MTDITRWAEDSFCYITTKGRVTGNAHEIEIWFVIHDDALHVISGGTTSDWVKNLRADPEAKIRVRTETIEATATFITDPTTRETPAKLLAAKYQNWKEGDPLSNWAQTGQVITFTPK